MKPIAKLAALPLVLSLVSCAHVGDAGMTLTASSVGAVAVVHDTLLLGKVVLLTNRSGTGSTLLSQRPRALRQRCHV